MRALYFLKEIERRFFDVESTDAAGSILPTVCFQLTGSPFFSCRFHALLSFLLFQSFFFIVFPSQTGAKRRVGVSYSSFSHYRFSRDKFESAIKTREKLVHLDTRRPRPSDSSGHALHDLAVQVPVVGALKREAPRYERQQWGVMEMQRESGNYP